MGKGCGFDHSGQIPAELLLPTRIGNTVLLTRWTKHVLWNKAAFESASGNTIYLKSKNTLPKANFGFLAIELLPRITIGLL